MTTKDFNKELETYIRARRKKNDIPSYYSTINIQEEKTAEEQEFSEEVMEEKTPHRGFFERMLGFFTVDKETEDQEEDVVEEDPHKEYREDIKRIGKATFAALNMLPKRKLSAFKESEHYLALRDILGKYKLIKPPREE